MSRVARCAALLVLVALFAPSIAAASHPSNEQKAIQAVKREIARRYPLLNATSPVVNADKAHVLITCEKASKTRFTCDWNASNDLHDQAEGSARVKVFSNAAQATIYNARCTNEITGICA